MVNSKATSTLDFILKLCLDCSLYTNVTLLSEVAFVSPVSVNIRPIGGLFLVTLNL